MTEVLSSDVNALVSALQLLRKWGIYHADLEPRHLLYPAHIIDFGFGTCTAIQNQSSPGVAPLDFRLRLLTAWCLVTAGTLLFADRDTLSAKAKGAPRPPPKDIVSCVKSIFAIQFPRALSQLRAARKDLAPKAAAAVVLGWWDAHLPAGSAWREVIDMAEAATTPEDFSAVSSALERLVRPSAVSRSGGVTAKGDGSAAESKGEAKSSPASAAAARPCCPCVSGKCVSTRHCPCAKAKASCVQCSSARCVRPVAR